MMYSFVIMHIITGGGECSSLEDFLWEEHNILIVYLPARTPEWNPIELIWNLLIRRLGLIPLHVLHIYKKDAVAHCATKILSEITHEDVYKTYHKCFMTK